MGKSQRYGVQHWGKSSLVQQDHFSAHLTNLSATVTLKLGSRSLKSNQPLSLTFHASLVKFHPLVSRDIVGTVKT